MDSKMDETSFTSLKQGPHKVVIILWIAERFVSVQSYEKKCSMKVVSNVHKKGVREQNKTKV